MVTVIDEDMVKECNDIIEKLEKSQLSTKIGMVQEILSRNVKLMKDIEQYQIQIDKSTSSKTGDNSEMNMEINGGSEVTEDDAAVVSGYVDSVQELNGNLSQVNNRHAHVCCIHVTLVHICFPSLYTDCKNISVHGIDPDVNSFPWTGSEFLPLDW